MALTAPVKWAQRKGSIFLTIDLPDVDEKTAKIELEDKKLTFKGTSEDKDYHVEIEFLHEIDSKAEDTKYSIKPRGVSFFLVKKEEGSWSRLLENKQLQRTNVKVDFNKWVDSDEEDETNNFNLDGMQGLGGMGGMPGMGMGGGAEAVFSDIKYITCPTCKALVRRAKKATDDLRSSLPNTKISEDRIDEVLENICDPHSDSGSWLAEYKIIEDTPEQPSPKTYLDLKRMGQPGPCLEDCMTVAATCERIMSEAGPDLVEKLWANKMDKTELTEFVCEKLTRKMKGSCGRTRLKIPESRKYKGNPKLGNIDPLDMEEINRKVRENPDLASTSKEEL
mmetsp:Transcript_6247/g.7855  ORF Transcript_6247/g.7855 Transcript_6247/m.7855 type:complete len:336 (+) Transcript_6247:218-1225(+)